MRRATIHPALVCLCLITAGLWASPALCQDDDESLKIYAVQINRAWKGKPWSGEGVYLGGGLALTAAHVAGLGIWRRPQVEIAGKEYPTEVLKDGHFHNVDVTLLSLDVRELPVSLGLRRMPLCRSPIWVGEPVVIATTDGVARSNVISPRLLPPGLAPEFQSVIRYVEESGASGSGVFDANKKCLLGIISGKISGSVIIKENGHFVRKPRNIAKYFVPASTIATFIPSEVRF